MVERLLKGKILSLVPKFPVFTPADARQSGKSTLLRHCFPDYTYVSLEDPDIRAFALQNPRGFLTNFSPPPSSMRRNMLRIYSPTSKRGSIVRFIKICAGRVGTQLNYDSIIQGASPHALAE